MNNSSTLEDDKDDRTSRLFFISPLLSPFFSALFTIHRDTSSEKIGGYRKKCGIFIVLIVLPGNIIYIILFMNKDILYINHDYVGFLFVSKDI